MKFLVPILFAAVLFAREARVEQRFNIQTVTVNKEETTQRRRFFGVVRANERRIVDVAPRFGGYVVKLYADTTYKKVEKGAPLALVYSPEVLKAKEEYLSSWNYNRQKSSPGMLQSAKRKLTLLGVDQSEIAQITQSAAVAPYTTIKAPEAGYLFVKQIVRGSAFQTGARLFRIVGLQSVWMEAKISQPEIPAALGADAYSVTTENSARTFTASSPKLYPNIDPKAALATLRLEIANPLQTLIPGMFAVLHAVTGPSANLVLPKTAVIRKMDRWYAFKAGEYEGEYEPVAVEVKVLDDERYAVLSGLREGDTVVDNALFLMDSDAQINGLF